MALSKCVQCGWEVSTEAANCPGCGAPVSTPATRMNWEPCPRCASGRVRHLARGGGFIVGVLLIIFGVVLLVIPPLGAALILAGWFLIAKANNRACLDCLYAWRYPSKQAQKHQSAGAGQVGPSKGKRTGLLIVGGVFAFLFILTLGIGILGDMHLQRELARADALWGEKKQAESTKIYVDNLSTLAGENRTLAYTRIITQLSDSGDRDGALEYSHRAIGEGLDINFGYADLDRLFDGARQAIVESEQREMAEKQAEEQRVAQEKAAVEQQQAMADAIQSQQAEAQLDANLSAYSTTLDAAGVTIVRNIGVKLNGDLWTVTLKVDNEWHYKPYQIRLQDTQTFWQVWAQIASPNEPDKARISIEDLNGNEVGGSRILAGSMIWVQE